MKSSAERNIETKNLADIKSMLFVGQYHGREHLNFLNKAITDFTEGLVCRTKIILFVDEKQLPENLLSDAKIHFFCRKDLNLFKKLKNEEVISDLERDFDLLLGIDFEGKDVVNKMIAQSHAKLKIGPARENIANFDMSFMLKKDDISELFDNCKKYLRKL